MISIYSTLNQYGCLTRYLPSLTDCKHGSDTIILGGKPTVFNVALKTHAVRMEKLFQKYIYLLSTFNKQERG